MPRFSAIIPDRLPRKTSFSKMQAVGNDFVVVATKLPNETEAAILLCDRHFGVGGDGLLIIAPSEVADFQMRMYNPDGTEDMCGNGLRCVIHRMRLWGRVGESGTVETLVGLRAFQCHPDGTITTEMGVPQFDPTTIPVDANPVDITLSEGFATTFTGDAVNTGSTHTVIFDDSPEHRLQQDEWFLFLSPQLEYHPVFPERTSLMWTVVEEERTLRLRIWERGVGETLGCGTGACAAAVIARRKNRVASEGTVTVHSRGGTLLVNWAGGDSDPIFLTGTAHLIYEGDTGNF